MDMYASLFCCPDAAAAFIERAALPDRVDDSNVTSAVSPEDMCAALKRLKRGKAAESYEINNAFKAITKKSSRQFSQHCPLDSWSAVCY